jgi:hypothetical protein
MGGGLIGGPPRDGLPGGEQVMGNHHARFRAMIGIVSGIRVIFRLFRLFYDLMLKSYDKLINQT